MNHTMQGCYPVVLIQTHFPTGLLTTRNETQSFWTANTKTGIFLNIRNNAIDNCFERLYCYILQLVKILSRLDFSVYIMHKLLYVCFKLTLNW